MLILLYRLSLIYRGNIIPEPFSIDPNKDAVDIKGSIDFACLQIDRFIGGPMDDPIVGFPDEFFCDPASYIYSASSVGIDNI